MLFCIFLLVPRLKNASFNTYIFISIPIARLLVSRIKEWKTRRRRVRERESKRMNMVNWKICILLKFFCMTAQKWLAVLIFSYAIIIIILSGEISLIKMWTYSEKYQLDFTNFLHSSSTRFSLAYLYLILFNFSKQIFKFFSQNNK